MLTQSTNPEHMNPTFVASELLAKEQGNRHNAEVLAWNQRNRFPNDRPSPEASFWLTTIAHIVDGTEDPQVADENGLFRKVLSNHRLTD